MTVEAGTQAYIQYTGTGSRVFYEYGFVMLEDSIVYVLVDGQPTIVTLQENGVVFDPAPALNAVILIYRITDITQLADFQQFEAFHGVKTEDALDKLILLKQEAAIFRAQMNLLANHQLASVTIENDKGTDAQIFLWNELEAGVFAGEVTNDMPNAGARVEKPEDFAYFQCGDADILTQVLTTTLYPLEAQDAIDLSVTLAEGSMSSIPEEQQNISWEFIGGTLEELLKTTGPYDEPQDLRWDFVEGTLDTLLLTTGPYDEPQNISWEFVEGTLTPLLVSVYSPDEAIELSVTLASGSMTPV